MLHLSETTSAIGCIFMVSLCGYILGRIRIKGVGLGTAGIFLSGLVFGHFGIALPSIVQTTGLVLFITAVGLNAGPGFLERLKQNGLQYVFLCFATALTGFLVCSLIINLAGIDAPLAVGIMTGAFTTSPGFAAAKEAVSPEAAVQVAAGYGLVYPVGVVCKVLFIQLIPRFLHADIEQERRKISLPVIPARKEKKHPVFRLDKLGFSIFCLAIIAGICLGSITIPLPWGGSFSLGSTGGPLVAGLIMGCIGQIGFLSLQPDPFVIAPVKELGLILFFSGAGVEGGHGIASILTSYGLMPLFYGLMLVTIPLLCGFLLFHFVLHLPLLNGLSSMTASMTCTPSLAMLTQLAGTDDVAAAYATTYPIALITLVITVQLLL